MQQSGKTGLTLSIIGISLVAISFWICGWLGFVGAFLGLLGMICNQNRTSAVVVGLIALIVGCIFGGIWAYAITQIR